MDEEFHYPLENLEFDFENERKRLEKENAALKEELAALNVLSDSCFLPLKPDSGNEKEYSTSAVAPSSTLTTMSTSSSSFSQLPRQKNIVLGNHTIQKPKQTGTHANTKSAVLESIYPKKYDDLRPNEGTPTRSLSAGALDSETLSTPHRFFEACGQIEIGRTQRTRPGQNDGTISQMLPPQTTNTDITITKIGRIHPTQPGRSDGTIRQLLLEQATEAGSIIGKKLNFVSSSEDESDELEKSSNLCEGILGKKEKDWQKRIIGEIAFQLDRRILQYIFTHRRRLYGFTVRNISQKIEEIGVNEFINEYNSGNVKISQLQERKDNLMKMLKDKTEYDPGYHPMFSELLVNKYGILKLGPREVKAVIKELQNLEFLTKIVTENVDLEYRKDAAILLRSLNAISSWDRKPILMW